MMGLVSIHTCLSNSVCAISFQKNTDLLILETKGSLDLKTWTLVEKFQIFRDVLCVLTWSSTGKLLASGFDNQAVIIEKNKDGKWVSHLIIMTNQYRSLLSGCWSPDGSKFALAGGNLSIYIGFLNTGSGLYDTEEFQKGNYLAF